MHLIRPMRKLGVVAAAATVGLAFGTGTHAAAASVSGLDLSSAQAINHYLTSVGANPATAIHQTGLLNYVGPACPGVGWTCAAPTGVAVVQQAAPGGINVFDCTAPTAGRCVAVQTGFGPATSSAAPAATSANGSASPAPEAGSNQATCTVTATSIDCTVAQSNMTGHNKADINEQMQQKAGDAQAATETAEVTQTSATGTNDAHVHQQIQQQINDSSASQSQQAVQFACVQQDSAGGDNHADVDQQQQQDEQSATPGVVQTQNQSSGTNGQCGNAALTISPNLGALIEQDQQTPGTGQNKASLDQQLQQQQQAKSTSSASSQQQGSSSSDGGLEGSIDQNSTGVSKADAHQQEHQVMDTEASGSSQRQFDPARCCSTQQSNPKDQFSINQQVSQDADQGAVQSFLVEANCTSSGSCDVHQQVTVNGQQQPTFCTTFPNEGGGQTTSCTTSNPST